MHDAEGLAEVVGAAMGVVEAAQHLHHDEEAEVGGHGELALAELLQELREVVALDVLHRDVEPTLFAAEVEGLHHIAVREARGEAGLGGEHHAEARVVGEAVEHQLDHREAHGAHLRGAAREVDLGHAAAPNAVKKHVAPEASGQFELRLFGVDRRRHAKVAGLSSATGATIKRQRTAIEKRRLVEHSAASQFWLLLGQRSR